LREFFGICATAWSSSVNIKAIYESWAHGAEDEDWITALFYVFYFNVIAKYQGFG